MDYDKEFKPIPGFHAVKFFRKIKKQISKKLLKLTVEERTKYLNSGRILHDLAKKK
jgi:hypothetical protein